MIATEITKIVQIRNDEINYQIKDVENTYNIKVTNELLKDVVTFSLNAIKYYNKKYNYFTGDEYEQLYLFGYKLYSIRNYNYNLLNSANYTNDYYSNFISNFDNELLSRILSDIFIIIQMQIEEITNRNNYTNKKNKKINMQKITDKNIVTLNLPIVEKELLLSYIYLNYNENINVCLESIQKYISDNLNLIKFGICTLIEDICFNFTEISEKTNLNAKYYFEELLNTNTNYNYSKHLNVLKYIAEVLDDRL